MTSKLFIFLLMALTLVRCTDTETFVPNPPEQTFKGSAFVEVVDIHGTALQGVKIQVGNIEGYTNEEGLLYLKNIQLKSSTYLTAEHAGYFHGSKRFYPAKNQTQFVRLMLLPETLAGTVQSDAGGAVQVSSDVKLSFPANAIVDKNGQLYQGAVSVYGQPLMADDPDLSDKMPGDLVGLTSDGSLEVLASLGMAVVELRSASGEKLQVKTGAQVELRINVPASMVGTAPSVIPMWYFDEELGLWKQEGEATLSGHTYVAQVGHFSYWNCDANFELVKWGATFVFEDGSPASQVSVCLTILELNARRCATTNNECLVCGQIAANQVILMEVMSPCGSVIYSQEIGPFNMDVTMGPITIPNSSVSFTAISGTAVDCNGDPVTNGFAKFRVGTQNYYTELDEETGAFSMSLMNCDESEVKLKVLDEGAQKQSLQYTFSYAPVIDAGEITVCETITEFIDLEVVGFPDHFYYYFPVASIQGGATTIYATDSTSNNQFFYVRFNGVTAGTYTASGAEIGMKLPNGDFAFATNVELVVTYFGGSGDYILGTLTATMNTGPNGQGGPQYPLVGSFSVLRD